MSFIIFYSVTIYLGFCIHDDKFHSYLEAAVTAEKFVLALVVVYDLPHAITMIR